MSPTEEIYMQDPRTAFLQGPSCPRCSSNSSFLCSRVTADIRVELAELAQLAAKMRSPARVLAAADPVEPAGGRAAGGVESPPPPRTLAQIQAAVDTAVSGPEPLPLPPLPTTSLPGTTAFGRLAAAFEAGGTAENSARPAAPAPAPVAVYRVLRRTVVRAGAGLDSVATGELQAGEEVAVAGFRTVQRGGAVSDPTIPLEYLIVVLSTCSVLDACQARDNYRRTKFFFSGRRPTRPAAAARGRWMAERGGGGWTADRPTAAVCGSGCGGDGSRRERPRHKLLNGVNVQTLYAGLQVSACDPLTYILCFTWLGLRLSTVCISNKKPSRNDMHKPHTLALLPVIYTHKWGMLRGFHPSG